MAEHTLRERVRNVSLIFACGTALFSDGYANNVIGSVKTYLTRIYGPDVLDRHDFSTILSSVAFAGTVVGMLVFGYLSDKMGRKFGMMTATAIVAFFSFLSACSQGVDIDGLLAMLCVMRFFLGIGIGAEYPCGSVSASEQSEGSAIAKGTQHRWFALATNSMIDFGFVIGAFVPLVLYWIFGNDHMRAAWRGSLALGTIPAVLVFVWRLNMDEPERYKKDSMKHAKIPYMLVLKRYGFQLAAISFTWFLYDFIVYPFGLYSSTVVDNITGGATALSVVFGWNVVINIFYLPGTLIGAFIVDYLGPKNTMIFGLIMQAIIGFIMSGCYKQLSDNIAAFAVVYGIFLSFGEVGPGNCLGLLASKTSPTAIRGHFYGIAAAVGKIGAFVGTWAFPPMIDAFGGSSTDRGNTGPFWVGSGLAILSALVTYFFIKPLEHDGMLEEDAKFREYLEANGYDTSQMGLVDMGSTASVDIEKDKKELEV
ncbi:major facilitator superfamily domain-containing protein [Schizophyllum amplum]|uniref:Major facilitator superfamily domain-containing protein n=1 Tax=Schizophyllum amplum TaxID=97359 RepID=A0A550CI22_9AGAR|nr:major facilitator superfamily domain-containing protein [Auriculariopsis ampla]